MTILTDDMIEKGARAAYLSRYPNGTWESTVLKPAYMADARACLEAVLPDVVESCAKVAEDVTQSGWRDDIVYRIRSLTKTESGNGNAPGED